MKRPRITWGFTLMESLLAAVILVIAITAITMPFAVGASNEEIDGRMTLAVSLAQEMMEEVLSKPLVDPAPASDCFGPEPGESTRTRYDDLDDYKVWIEPLRQIKDAGGIILTGPLVNTLSRETYVENYWLAGQDHSKPADFFKVTVIIKHENPPLKATTTQNINAVEMVRLTRLVCKEFEFN